MHRIRLDIRSGTTVLQAEGELDAFAAPDLATAFEDAAGARRVLVDLERVSFMDSTALGLVARSVRDLLERGCEARVVLPRGSARRIFEITTLENVLPVARSRAEALAELAAGPPDDG